MASDKQYKGINIENALNTVSRHKALEEKMNRKPQPYPEDTLYMCYVDGIKKMETLRAQGKQLSEKDLKYLDFARAYILDYEGKKGMLNISDLRKRLETIVFQQQFPEYFSEEELTELKVEKKEIERKIKKMMFNERSIENGKHKGR
jgi:hypothetical protein